MIMPTITPNRPSADAKISTTRIFTNSELLSASASAQLLPTMPTHHILNNAEALFAHSHACTACAWTLSDSGLDPPTAQARVNAYAVHASVHVAISDAMMIGREGRRSAPAHKVCKPCCEARSEDSVATEYRLMAVQAQRAGSRLRGYGDVLDLGLQNDCHNDAVDRSCLAEDDTASTWCAWPTDRSIVRIILARPGWRGRIWHLRVVGRSSASAPCPSTRSAQPLRKQQSSAESTATRARLRWNSAMRDGRT